MRIQCAMSTKQMFYCARVSHRIYFNICVEPETVEEAETCHVSYIYRPSYVYVNLNFPKRQCVCCIMRASHWKLARIGRRLCYGTRAVNAAHDIHIWRSQCIWGHIYIWWYAISAVLTSYTTFCIYVNDKYLKFLWIILVNVCRLSGFFGFVCASHRAECS